MKEENSSFADQSTKGFYKFSYAKNVRTWQDLLNTLKPISFDESFNLFTDQQIEHFWRLQLEQLSKQTQKICILVPVQVKIKINKKVESTIRQPNEFASQNAKEKNKGKKNSNENKVVLNKKILQAAIKLIQKDFPKLSYDYASLFVGNQKQLLIYRCCFAIQSYIEKYRLPNTFKQPFAHLQRLTDQYFYLKIQRNKAISTFDTATIQKSSRKIDNILTKIKKAINQFRDQWKMILYDFRAKSKCKDLILNHISVQLIDQLRPLCLQCQTDIISRYSQCEFDQYKDIVVIKKEDIRLKNIEYGPQQQPITIKYEYISAKKQPEPPFDIKNLQFIGIDLKKQCYTYNFQFQRSSEQNMLQGLFIRSQHGDHIYELNIDVKPNCKDITVDIYPYRHGKSVYEIYTWNHTGFTKSTDKIVLYNQMPFTKQGQCIKNYNVYFLGQSECGLRYCEDNNQDEIIIFQYSKICQTAKNIDICNSAIICDAVGEVAIWGEIYNPYSDQQTMIQDISPKHFKIQPPSIVMSKKYIRKVSCGASYSLMVSTFGQVYSMGINQFGQLGLGHTDRKQQNYNPNQICKFTNDNSPFIVDIHASISGGSFAINSKGQLYRWGRNQVEQTVMAIEDRFGSIINYSASTINFKCCNPTKVSKQLLREPIKQIISGNNFYFALTYSGVLYGWGQCTNLGIDWLYDKEERVVLDIVNPIELMNNIQSIVAGLQHVVAITKQGKIIGWGDITAFSKYKQAKFTKTPIDVTQQYGGRQQVKLIRAGRGYTVLLNHANQLKIIGKCEHFQKSNYKFDVTIVDFTCSDEEFIAILCEKVI